MSRTRIVSWLRVILPISALVILSTLFLFSSRPDRGDGLPYADMTAEELAQRAEIGEPSYAGVASDGTQIEVAAASASPSRGAGRGTISQVALTLRTVEGLVSDLVAAEGEMRGDQLRLIGDVGLTTSTGWQIHSQEFIADTVTGTL